MQYSTAQAGGLIYGHHNDQEALEDGACKSDQIPQSHKQRPDFKSRGYDDDDDTSSVLSTAPSSAPSESEEPPPAGMGPINYGYEYRCPFEFVGCGLSFHPTQIDAYISHTASHFLDHRPPPKTICIFCDQTFENYDRDANWRNRMRHITNHYRGFEQFEHTRPDFFVIEYMREKRIISSEHWKRVTNYTERMVCDGLIDFGHKTSESRRKEGRALEERHDLEKDDRYRRRYMASKGKGKGKGPVENPFAREDHLEVRNSYIYFLCDPQARNHVLMDGLETNLNSA